MVGVFGLDNRPQAQPRIQYYDPAASTLQAHAVTTSYTPAQLAHLYDFPTTLDGHGQCIALIELGGGYKLKDLKTYFHQLNLPLPKATSLSVDGGHNHPVGTPNSADGEVGLDIEVAGAIAPGAHIVVYFAPNTARGFIDAVAQAIHDSTNNPTVISISWGAPEVDWTTQAMQAMDQTFQAAAALGITVCCAAGDKGSGDGVRRWAGTCRLPCLQPPCLGLWRHTARSSPMQSRVRWSGTMVPGSATGGGVSDVFDLPPWQDNAGVPPSINSTHRVGRGVPDIAGNADPQTGYQVHVDGQNGCVRRDQCCGASVGRFDRSHKSATGATSWLPKSHSLPELPTVAPKQCLARCDRWQQWRLFSRSGVGCVHRIRDT